MKRRLWKCFESILECCTNFWCEILHVTSLFPVPKRGTRPWSTGRGSRVEGKASTALWAHSCTPASGEDGDPVSFSLSRIEAGPSWTESASQSLWARATQEEQGRRHEELHVSVLLRLHRCQQITLSCHLLPLFCHSFLWGRRIDNGWLYSVCFLSCPFSY